MHLTLPQHRSRSPWQLGSTASLPVSLTVSLLSGLALGGCASPSTTPSWDAGFGDAVRTLQAGQLIAPDAPTRHGQATPPADGRSVGQALQRLQESHRNPPASHVLPTRPSHEP